MTPSLGADRAAVLSQAGAPPVPDELASRHVFGPRARKAVANEYQPQRAEKAMITERGPAFRPRATTSVV